MSSVADLSKRMIPFIGVISLIAIAPAFAAHAAQKGQHVPVPPCSNDQVWDTEFQRCLSFRSTDPADKQPLRQEPTWALGDHDSDEPLGVWN